MARTYTTVGWEDGTVLQPAKVTVQGTEYNVENEVVTGRTPINAQNLRKMDNEIKRIVEEDIPSVYDEKLLTISDTAPSECIEGDKYYNTTDNKIYIAVATDTWSQDGDTPIEGKLYIVFNEQSTYAYNGTTLVSVGGGSGSSDIVIIGDETEATEDTKLIIEEDDMNLNLQGSDFLNEYSESTEKGYSCNYTNNKINEIENKIPVIESGVIRANQMTSYTLGSDTLSYYTLTFENQYTNPPTVVASVWTANRTGFGIEKVMVANVSNTQCDLCLNLYVNAGGYGISYMVISND